MLKPQPKYITDLIAKGKGANKSNKIWLKRAKQKKGLEKQLPDLHDAAFEKIDCLDCGNCCGSISPRFKTPDIKRIAKFLGMKESPMIAEYLLLDQDGDYVIKKSPCLFYLTTIPAKFMKCGLAIAPIILIQIRAIFLNTPILHY